MKLFGIILLFILYSLMNDIHANWIKYNQAKIISNNIKKNGAASYNFHLLLARQLASYKTMKWHHLHTEVNEIGFLHTLMRSNKFCRSDEHVFFKSPRWHNNIDLIHFGDPPFFFHFKCMFFNFPIGIVFYTVIQPNENDIETNFVDITNLSHVNNLVHGRLRWWIIGSTWGVKFQ